jgi:excinuclease ABC subunit A
LQLLLDQGHSVVIIEHNLDVIDAADWVVDLGPEGGDAGGTLVGVGSPEAIADLPESYTGQFLRPLLREGRMAPVSGNGHGSLGLNGASPDGVERETVKVGREKVPLY